MKSSVLTSDLEKQHCLPPYEVSLNQTRKQRQVSYIFITVPKLFLISVPLSVILSSDISTQTFLSSIAQTILLFQIAQLRQFEMFGISNWLINFARVWHNIYFWNSDRELMAGNGGILKKNIFPQNTFFRFFKCIYLL